MKNPFDDPDVPLVNQGDWQLVVKKADGEEERFAAVVHIENSGSIETPFSSNVYTKESLRAIGMKFLCIAIWLDMDDAS